jgi:hypothetical protein
MDTAAATAVSSNYPNRALRGILLGGLAAGLADFIYPTARAVMAGGSWTRPWMGVATGLLGPAAREGGMGVVALGIALHFFICCAAAAILYLFASRVRIVPRHWLPLGILHGIAVLLVMNYLVLPLSGIGRSIYPLQDLHVHAFWHIVLVGLPTAFFVARALKAR